MSREYKLNIRQYYLEFIPAMLAYMILLMLVVSNRPDGGGYAGYAKSLELLPTIPLLLSFWAIIRQYRRMDEYYKRIQAEAFALAALIWGLIIMIWGFAENAAAPTLSTMWVAPILIALWGLAVPIVSRRYK